MQTAQTRDDLMYEKYKEVFVSQIGGQVYIGIKAVQLL